MRILLIDDEDAFRTLAGRMLATKGYDVIEAADGNAALASYRQEPSDLVITDIRMPGKDGLATIRELRRHDPLVKIIAMSGADPELVESYLKVAEVFGACRILRKPFSRDALLSAVADALAT